MCFWAVHVGNFRVFERRLRRAQGSSLSGVNPVPIELQRITIFIDMFGWTDLTARLELVS